MKTYIIYVKGVEIGYIKADSHNAAEKKAYKIVKKYGEYKDLQPHEVTVAYTEL